MHELSILAATLEHLMHDEAVDRLKEVYVANGLDHATTTVSYTKARSLTDSYMTLFILGRNYTTLTTQVLKELERRIRREYTMWEEYQSFSDKVQTEVLEETNGGADDIS